MKKKDIIIIVVILLVGLGLFFGLKTYLDKNYEKKEDNSSKVDKENIKIDETMVNKLFDSLITKDNSHGLYFTEKVTSSDSNVDFILFNIAQYLIDNNSDYLSVMPPINGGTVYLLFKNELNDYINKKYNTTAKYDLPESKSKDKESGISLRGSVKVFSEGNEWVVRKFYYGEDIKFNYHKLLEYKSKGDIIEIYTKYVACYGAEGGNYCKNNDDILLSCYAGQEDCPAGSHDTKVMSEYILNNSSDKLSTYKHTFKKSGDNYYWYSSEIIN